MLSSTHAFPEQSVRTLLHISPSVAAAAIMAAQRRGLRLQQWLDAIVVEACLGTAKGSTVGGLCDDATIELFAHVANFSPGPLTGRWKLLFERIRLEDGLWDYPVGTMEQEELDPDCLVQLNLIRLKSRWPGLLASCFAL